MLCGLLSCGHVFGSGCFVEGKGGRAAMETRYSQASGSGAPFTFALIRIGGQANQLNTCQKFQRPLWLPGMRLP